MHIVAWLSAVSAIAAPVFAKPIGRSMYTVKNSHRAPSHWMKLDRAHGKHMIELQIGLKQGRFDELDRHLHEVSDPDHPRYGQHLTADEVNELVAPSHQTHDLVHEWLSDNGIESHEVNYNAAKDWIIVSLPIQAVEDLLDTEYYNYKHKDGSIVARATSWSLPRHLHSHIDTIQPTNSFFHITQNAATWVAGYAAEVPASFTPPTNADIAAVCHVTAVTPECFQTLYHTNWYNRTQARDNNSIAFTNYLGQIPIRPDTKLFLDKYQPEASHQAYDFKAYSIDNGPVQDGPLSLEQAKMNISFEANLDVQAIAGISLDTPIISYSTGGSPPFNPDIKYPTNFNEPYLVWVNWLLQQNSIPPVISSSYSDEEQTVPRDYAERVCKQFAQVGARGTTLFFSSGDYGIGGTNTCVTNDGKNTTQFLPNFPASCPYVTTVGATMNFQPEESAYIPASNVSNVYVDLYSSGSGFSNYFPRPEWQNAVVPQYIEAMGEQYAGLWNKTGRAYPDLAAQGLYFAYFWNGTESTISGTSASCPLTAGIFSLVNDALIASGKKPLGWLNPWLYKTGYKGLTDIKKGFSYGCNVQGFPVTEGWDPVTGFGTPNFPLLLKEAGITVGGD